ncbi:MAG: polysaccharide deacetylase family protein [Candidatus Parabeggiatoa sp.]|nr:polysaccharide deacetylase family protein [Candidatus Parabeggiatoa sp.]
MNKLLILMYHRVCNPCPDTACYFTRGTAITPQVFHAQLQGLSKRVRFVTLSQGMALLHSTKFQTLPLCAITFDDGYRDVLDHNISDYPLTLYPVARHLGEAHTSLIFIDHYYALLQRAQKRHGIRLEGLFDKHPVNIDNNLAWWVKGAVKEYLQQASPHQRSSLLQKMTETLHVASIPTPEQLYLSQAELFHLAKRGHEIGGHGASHHRLTFLSETELQRELIESYQLVEKFRGGMNKSFCYPDGRYNQHISDAVKAVGFDYACTVAPGNTEAHTPFFQLPRIFMKNDFVNL